MPPKKSRAGAKSGKRKVDEVVKDEKPEGDSKPVNDEQTTVTDQDEPPKKAQKTNSPLDWLLSDEAFNLANPDIPEGHGEIDWDASDPKEKPAKVPPKDFKGTSASSEDSKTPLIRYPESSLTPFQNLVCASILSKPLSHKLGLRTIQTLLNPPFSLRTLKDLDEAGYEGRRKVMWEARTQHKERTASLLGDLCEGIKELCGDNEDDLSGLTGVKEQLKDCKKPEDAQEKVVSVLTNIKGIGPGVAAIFLRRVQADWEEVFPYVDDRSLKAARAFGLVKEGEGAEQLADCVAKDRSKYVKLVDTLVGIELEKKMDEALQSAGVHA